MVACSVAPLLDAGAAHATDLPPPVYKPVAEPPLPPPALWSNFYAGGALNWVHHTGYVPTTGPAGNLPYSAQAYTFGGKIFGGYRLNPNVQFELAYHYLGEITFFEGTFPLSHERSQALAGSVMFVSPNLSPYFYWAPPVPIHAFVRFGLAYKDILHTSAVGDFREGILSGVFGAGWEYRIQNMFVRIEYEYISTAIGGPPMAVPGLKGDWHVTIGGTHRAINVMHTPIALTVGVNL